MAVAVGAVMVDLVDVAFLAVMVLVTVFWVRRKDREIERALLASGDATIEEAALDALESVFEARGYGVHRHQPTIREAVKGGTTWAFASYLGTAGAVDVAYTAPRVELAGEATLELETASEGGRCRVGLMGWSERVLWSRVGDQLVSASARDRLARLSAHEVRLDALEQKVSFRLDPERVVDDAAGALDELDEVVAELDACVPPGEDEWLVRLEEVMARAPSSVASSYLRERVERGHVSPEEAIMWFFDRFGVGYVGLGALLEGASPEAFMEQAGDELAWEYMMRLVRTQHESDEARAAFVGFIGSPRFLAWAARTKEAGAEHRVVAALVDGVDDATLEDAGVVEGLLDQIERSPPGSKEAVVNALLDRPAVLLRRRLVGRVRGADPLSPITQAAQRLCDPERLSGALTEAGGGPAGGLTQADGGGGLTEVE
jgi:hypothetical protein